MQPRRLLVILLLLWVGFGYTLLMGLFRGQLAARYGEPNVGPILLLFRILGLLLMAAAVGLAVGVIPWREDR